MRSKRLLAMLMALCLVMGCFAPAVSAKEANAANSLTVAEKDSTSFPFSNDLIITGEEDADEEGILNLRDDPIVKSEIVENTNMGDGEWDFNLIEKPNSSNLFAETPECIEELQKAAEVFAADDMVRAIVVMEDAALADTLNSYSLVDASIEKQMIEKQNSVISAIESKVLGGQKLNVRYQFTYLTNSFSIETEFANLEKIAYVSGVKSVFVAPVYNPCHTNPSTPNTAASGAMTGVHTVWEELGYTGEGMTIAIIDTGLDLDHPSFQADPATNENSMTVADIAAVLEDLNAHSVASTLTAENLYRSVKVPYAFNYVDRSLTADHSSDQQGDHGTHVAGIAAANATEGTTVVGMAPDAQIIVMKVFGANGGAYTDDIVAALEDAMILGCDVVNASLGTPAGFSSTDTEMDLIYQRLATQDTVACFSAGNEATSSYSNMWGTDLSATYAPDNSTVGSPSTYANSFSIASAENSEVMTTFFSLADGTQVFYNDTLEAYQGYIGGMYLLEEQELEYVIIDGLGHEENFYDADGNSLVEGKIAVVRRGEINFGLKILNAEMAGAVGVVIWNNNDTDDIFNFYMSVALEDDTYPGIPACLITQADGQKLADAETKTMTISAEMAARMCEGGQMSSFSSWGVSSDLRLLPDITGIGGNVYSTLDDGNYGLMSGTSMSSPQIAGVSALVMQYLQEIYPNAAAGTIRELTLNLLMSTAAPIVDTESQVEASPRQQGAGLVDAAAAVTTESYLTVGGNRPKAELGDGSTGNFSFTFEIHNISDAAQTYALSSSLLTEDVVDYGFVAFMAGHDIELSGSVTFSQDTVTVPAGGTASVNVSIALSEEDKAMFAHYWANGGYVEGYVYLTNEDGVDLSLPFLGFYGSWADVPVMDTAFWYDNSFWGLQPANGLPEGEEYYHVMWTNLAGQDWVLGMNPYSGAYADANGNIAYDPAHNTLSPNGDGVLDSLDDIYVSLLRNAKTLTLTYTANGEVLSTEVITNAPKTMYISAYGQVVPWLYSWYGNGMYDFTDAEGNVLPDGTEVTLTIDADADYGNGGNHSIEIPIIIDNTAPELISVVGFQQDGMNILGVEASDAEALAAMFLMNTSGTQTYGVFYDNQLIETEDGTFVQYFEVTGLGTELTVALCDYAANEAYYNVTFEANGDNLPDMPSDQLYAYRVFDDHIASDHMYGWVSLNMPESAGEYANISVWSDDYLEYAAINAAEYAGGKIFAIDAVYNFIVMDAGLWNRTTICNLGVNALDMTFDDSTDTMYVLTKDEYDNVALQTVDVMTGELTMVYDFGYAYNGAPYGITDDDNGGLYAIAYGSDSLYSIDAANEYAMEALTTADGAPLAIVDANGNALNPNYAQSLAYVDGIVYWAYFNSSYWSAASELIAINVADATYTSFPYAGMAYDANYNVVEYYPVTELVGLLTLTETDFTIPEAEELVGINLSDDMLVMTVGQRTDLTATATPWNYALSDLVWTSSDESVATVQNGKVTAVGEGEATITVAYGDITASAYVIADEISGHFNAYNYYSGDGYYGYMIDVDMETMDYHLGIQSPIDFIAADYNGHDGFYYGYAESGQFYRVDLETAEVSKLGAPVSTLAADMAYDYSTGTMYAITVDYMNGISSLCTVNLKTGELQEVYQLPGFFMMTLAIDLEGNIYTITADGMLLKLSYVYDDWFGEYAWMPEILMEGLGQLQYMQSMCYDHSNDVILWGYPEGNTVAWINVKSAVPYAISLGDPTESGIFEFVGMFTVPEEIPALPEVAVESVSAADMMMLVGGVKFPAVQILPFNATCQDIVWTSSDSNIVVVNADGSVTGVSEGTATISGTLTDTVGGTTYELSIDVTVLNSADNIFGHVMTDLASYGGQFWINMDCNDPAAATALGSTPYVIYAEEYYNGKLYAFGYDPNDWEANWQFFVMDAGSYAIEEQYDMGEGFPFVYDMTYDYATSTMYAVAGASDSATDLYAVNMETGELVLMLATEQFFMSITSSTDGTLYAMEMSESVFDPMTWSSTLGNANLYTIDPIAGEVELVGDTGIQNNMLSSMAYDYDTGYIYWTPMAQTNSYVGGLAIVDPATGAALNLGSIGPMGAQVSGLYIVSDNFPEEGELELKALIMDTANAVVTVGATAELNAYTLPMAVEADIVWTSSDETIATVEGGVVTGVSQGMATITATATVNGITKTAECQIAVLDADAAFLSWNATDMGWSSISRADYTVVTNLTEGEEVGVSSVAAVGYDVYGFDLDNNLFQLNTTDYTRNVIGQVDLAAVVDNYLTENGLSAEDYPIDVFQFAVRDMAYDYKNERMLALGNLVMYDPYYEEYSDIIGGCSVYEVDLTTGELTALFSFEDLSAIFGLTVNNDGDVFFYTSFNDGIYCLDLEDGTYEMLVSLQTQSVYGENMLSIRHAMFYDYLTDTIYLEVTSNGNFYRMVTINPTTGALTVASNIGEVVYDPEAWSNIGDVFSGLVFVTDAPELPQYILGDANGDGTVNNIDAMLVLQYSVGMDVEINADASDVNGDGTANNIDAMLILQFSVGLIQVFPAA